MSETKGSWKTSTAGGCFNKPSWRLNQQWLLRVDATVTDFKLDLTQTGNFNIGVYLLKDSDSSSLPIYHGEQEKLLHKSGFKSKAVVSIEIPKLEKGVYHVIPCTFEPGKEGKFVLKSTHGKLKRVSMWNVTVWKGAWKGASAGGCKNHKSFKENPQFLFKIEGEESAKAMAVLSQDEHEEFDNLGFYVFKTEVDSEVKVVYEKDIVTAAPFEDDCEASHEFKAELAPGDYSLIPTTFSPSKESKFTIHLFTSLPIYDQQNPPPKPEAVPVPLQTGPTAAEMSAKWADEIRSHQDTIKQVAALQEQLRAAKDSNRELNVEIEALRRGGGVVSSGPSSATSSGSSAVPEGPRVATTEPQTGTQVSVFGAWEGESAGGCMNHATWRKNPQLFLTVPSEGTKATFHFVQEPNAQGKCSQIGFYILHGSLSQGHKVVWLDNGDEDIVSKPKFTSSKQLKIDMTLPATSPKEPYVIVPCTYSPGEAHQWTFTATTDSPVTLSPVPPAGAWKSISVAGEWNEETAGGCRNHSTFLNNPQYLLTIPEGTVEPQGRVLLFQSEKSDFDSISVYIVKLASASTAAKPTKLTKVEAADVLLKPSFNNPEETCIPLPTNLSAGRYVLIPCTFAPKNLAAFELQLVSTKSLQLEALGDGTDLSVTGEWRGKTAGGCLNDPIPFKHNTQFHLSLKAEHTLVFKQSQQPDAALVTQGFYIFKAKSAKRKFKIKKDDQIAKSGFTKSKDLIGEHTLPAGEYIVVPCTFNPAEEANFKLSVFSKANATNFLEICQFQPLPQALQEFSGNAEWTPETAGGCLNQMTWVFNPQFQFTTDKKCEATIFLSVPTLDSAEKIQAFSGIGFYLVSSDPNSPVRLEMSPKDVIKKASFRRSNEVAVQVTLEAGSYNIVPATLKAGFCAPFTVSLFTDNLTSAEFRNLSGSVKSFRGEWTEANAGGNTSNMEKWLTNARYYIAAKKYVKMSILLLQRPELSVAKGDQVENSSWKAVGFVVTNGDVDGHPKTSQATDLIAAAPFEAERDVVATFALEPTLEPFVVVPSTFEAGQLGTYSLSFIMDPAVADSVVITTTPPNISEAELQEQLQAEVLVAKLQKCVNTTASSAAELSRLIKLAGLSALDSPSSQLTAVVRKLQALLNALKAPELYAKEIEAEAAQVAEASAAILPGPPPPPPPAGGVPKAPAAPSQTATGSVESDEVYDGASKGLKPAADRQVGTKSYTSPQEEMLAMIAQGRAQLKSAADRKLKDKPADKDSLLCAFANSFDMITARRRAVEGEDEEEDDDDDDWD